MAENQQQQTSKRRRIVSVRASDTVEIGGVTRNHVSVLAEWAKHPNLALELEHASGMSVYIRWNARDTKGVWRHEALVHCHQINFEPLPQ